MGHIRIACLPVGSEWQETARERFEGVLGCLPECFAVETLAPAVDEADVLRRVEAIGAGKPDMLLLAAIHGGSARAMTLAGVRCGVPVAIWCHDERHSLASSALASEALRTLGHPHVLLHGADAAGELEAAGRAAAARRRMSEARIGQIGAVHHNLVSAVPNPLVLTSRFGAWVVPVAVSCLRSRLSEIGHAEIEKEVAGLRSRYRVSSDDESLRKAAGMHLALAGIVRDHALDAVAVDCWNEIMPEFGVTPCLGFARDDYRIACEGDVVSALTLLAGEAISGRTGYVGDLYSLDEETGSVALTHCGGCCSLHSGSEAAEIARQSPPAGQSAAVVACRPVLPTGSGTMVMLHGERLDRLHLCRCEIVSTDHAEQMRVRVRIEADPASFRKQASGNHYVVFAGDTTEAWRIWAGWSGVAVH